MLGTEPGGLGDEGVALVDAGACARLLERVAGVAERLVGGGIGEVAETAAVAGEGVRLFEHSSSRPTSGVLIDGSVQNFVDAVSFGVFVGLLD